MAVPGPAGTIALVLELVEGPTLADRIARGPIPLDEALPIARQIAEASASRPVYPDLYRLVTRTVTTSVP